MGYAIKSFVANAEGSAQDLVKNPAKTISGGFDTAANVLNNPLLNPVGSITSQGIQGATGITPGQQLMAGAAGGAAAYGSGMFGAGAGGGGAGGALTPALTPAAGMSLGEGMLLGGGLNLASGYIGSEAAKDAAKTQSEAAASASANTLTGMRESNALQKQIYDQNRTDNSPWRDAGAGALNKLQMGMEDGGQFSKKFSMADFQADPNYQFNIDQGNRSIESSAAARGGVLSGAAMKELARFGQNTANQEYGNQYNRFENNKTNQFNRLSGIAGTGQTAVNQIGQAGNNFANAVSNNNNNGYNQVGSNIIGAGNANASGQVGQANAWGNAIGQGLNMYNQNNMLNRMYPQTQQQKMLNNQWS